DCASRGRATFSPARTPDNTKRDALRMIAAKEWPAPRLLCRQALFFVLIPRTNKRATIEAAEICSCADDESLVSSTQSPMGKLYVQVIHAMPLVFDIAHYQGMIEFNCAFRKF